jgi:hypothetical protein
MATHIVSDPCSKKSLGMVCSSLLRSLIIHQEFDIENQILHSRSLKSPFWCRLILISLLRLGYLSLAVVQHHARPKVIPEAVRAGSKGPQCDRNSIVGF